jgi:hypothetical protein
VILDGQGLLVKKTHASVLLAQEMVNVAPLVIQIGAVLAIPDILVDCVKTLA